MLVQAPGVITSMPSASAGAAAGAATAGEVEGDGAVGGGESAVVDEGDGTDELLGLDGFTGGTGGRFAGLGEGFSFLENCLAAAALVFV
jgi:hypothetical protein